MQYSDIKKRVASYIGYVDSSGAILASKDITETDIGNAVNDRYLDELFPLLSSQYPEDFNQSGKLNFYKASGTAAAASTSTTLVTTGNVFNNGMVGDKVYNSTDSEIATITAYTSATTVTIDETIDDDWDGDTVYVLGHEFGLGGNATDMRSLTKVAVKYSSDDDFYTVCEQASKNSLVRSGDETYLETNPKWYQTTVDISGVPTSAIGILPEASVNVAEGIYIEYTEVPAALSSDTDVPRLPLGSHSTLVDGAAATMLRKLMRLDESDRLEQKFQSGKLEMVTAYALTRGSGTPRVRPGRSLRQFIDRVK